MTINFITIIIIIITYDSQTTLNFCTVWSGPYTDPLVELLRL